MRKLSTIEQILQIKELPNSDFLEVIKVRGWTLVAKKGEFQVGDKCVYFEIDSFLPIKPEFEFLRKSSYKKLVDETEGFRIKTVKLRGQISQGLALPLNTFFNLPSEEIGYCLDDFLGITLYTPPIPANLSGLVKGRKPYFIPKTDQERIQNIWEEISPAFQNSLFEETLKLDGTSTTIYFFNASFGVCSRNMELLESESNSYWQITRQLDLERKLRILNQNIAIQGELMGEGIQGNKEKIKGIQIYVFDIWDIDRQAYLSSKDRYNLCDTLALTHVPIINKEVCLEGETLDSLLERAKGVSLKNQIREGIVFKAINGGFSFKVINNDFLVKYD